MANVKINDLALIADPASTDVLPIVDVTLDTTNKISIADILKTAPEGTAAAPAIAFEGDSNTGIYHPGSEQIGFATSGLGRLFIASDGNIGVGTAAPGYALEVLKASPTYNRVAQFTSDSTVSLIAFGGSNGTGEFAPEIGQDNSTLVFNTQNQERMRIDVTGNVGIGTTSPNARLEVRNTANSEIRISDTAGGYGNLVYNESGTVSVFEIGADPANTSTPNTELGFSVDGTRVITCLNSGDVGIGTSSPQNVLDVLSQNSNTDETVAAFGNQTIQGGLQVITNGNLDWGFNARNSRNLVFRTNQTERMRITSSGNIGIGTGSPDELLHIEGNLAEFKGTNTNAISDTAGTEQVFKFGIEGQKNNVYGPAGSIIFRQDGSSWSSVEVNQKPTRIEFCTQDSTASDTSESPRMVIDQDGNVGIGTSNPQARLDIRTSAGTDCQLFLNEATTTNAFQIKQTSTEARIQTTASQPLVIAGQGGLGSTSDIRFETRDNERMRIDSSGRLLIGTSNARNTRLGTTTITPIAQTLDSGNGGFFVYNNVAGPNPATIYAAKSRGNDYTTAVQNGDALFRISAAGADGTQATEAARITAEVDGTPGVNNMPGRLVFATTADAGSSPAERMRINSTGNVIIGTSSTTISSLYPLQAVGSRGAVLKSTGGGGNSTLTLWNNENVNDCSLIDFRTNTVDQTRGSVTYNASTGLLQYNTTSDYRAKTLNGFLRNASDSVASLSVYEGTMNGATEAMPMMVAHEVQEVAPYCVTGEKDATDENGQPVYQQLDYSSMVPLLTAALQEALAKIETLEQRLTDAGL